MFNLVVDIGNTNSKWAVFKDSELQELKNIPGTGSDVLIELLGKYAITHSTLSSVNYNDKGVVELLKMHTQYVHFNVSVSTGIINRYETPETLGLDRWAKIVAVHRLYRDTNCLIIDAGTCNTYDLLTADGIYNGGSISPGITMRFKALHNYTGKLPLVDWLEKDGIPEGNNTQNAIKNGVLQGILNEVKGYIADNNTQYSALKILLTGGNADFLSSRLKNSIFAPQIISDPSLVFKGLNEVIKLEQCS